MFAATGATALVFGPKVINEIKESLFDPSDKSKWVESRGLPWRERINYANNSGGMNDFDPFAKAGFAFGVTAATLQLLDDRRERQQRVNELRFKVKPDATKYFVPMK